MSETWLRLSTSPYRSYEVSSDGRVRRDGRELKGFVDRYGYRTVLLSYAGLSRRFKVHRLVCEAFHGPALGGLQAAHLDGNPLNNDASNLAWKSAADNNADKLLHGTHQAGVNHPRARLNKQQVEHIRASPLSSRAAAREFGIAQSHVVRIRKGHRWPEGIAQTPAKGPFS